MCVGRCAAQSTSYEEAQQKVVTLASSGNLTESVAEVAVQALQQCRDKGDNPQMEQTLDGLVQLIITALQQQMMSPALRLVEELVQMNPSENRQLSARPLLQLLRFGFKIDASSGRRSGQRARNRPAGSAGHHLALHRLPLPRCSPTHYSASTVSVIRRFASKNQTHTRLPVERLVNHGPAFWQRLCRAIVGAPDTLAATLECAARPLTRLHHHMPQR